MNKRLAIVAVSTLIASLAGVSLTSVAQNDQPTLKASSLVQTPVQDTENTADETSQPTAKITESTTQPAANATSPVNQPEAAQSTTQQDVPPTLVTKTAYSMDTSGGSYCELTYSDGSTLLKQAEGNPTKNINGSFSYDPHCQDYLGQVK